MNLKLDFNNWEDFITQAEKPRHETMNADSCSSRWIHCKTFQMTTDFPEVLSLARNGWNEGLRLAEKTKLSLSTNGSFQGVMSQVYRSFGSSVEIGRYLANDPNCFRQKKKTVRKGFGSLVSITVNGVFPHTVGTDIIVRRGSAIMLLIDALETIGKRCELDLNIPIKSNSFGESSLFETNVRLKNFDCNLSLEKVAFALCHPDVLRRLIFSIMEQQNNDFQIKYGVGYVYGYPSESKTKGDIYIPACGEIDTQFKTDANAISWVKTQLRMQGIEV